MRYGFVLDQTRCIGCHACTVACKSENQVPLGVFRTWVKYIERGTFPDARRFFSVMRCNQCDAAPCVAICPTQALHRRPDGIVDFDKDRCIGCKSCMQACPYDALYIDPETQTAAKCNYCAHRTDQGLEPACVVVCPTQAIVPGDLDNPESRISRIVARRPVSVRKPEKGTKPKVFYLGADEASLSPSIERQAPEFLFATPTPRDPELATPESPIRETYDVPHDAPWGWKIWTYLWTKSIAAGALIVAGTMAFLFRDRDLLGWGAGIVALFLTAVTSGLLALDLRRPERFWFILTKPNLKSWVVLGTYVLIAYTGLSALWIFAPGKILAIPAILLGAAAAGYTAFLFWQCRGRDLWTGPILIVHLLVEAVLCGASVLLLMGLLLGSPIKVLRTLETFVGLAAAAHVVTVMGELLAHGSADGAKAARLVWMRPSFWRVVLVAGAILPVAAAVSDSPVLWALGALGALAGAFEFGRLWVKAGQAVPLS